MNPNYNQPLSPSPWFRIRKYVLLASVLLIGFFVANSVWNILTFRVTGTDPGMSNVAAASAYIDIDFNKSIVAKSLSLKYSTPFVTKTVVTSNRVRLDIQGTGLEVGKRYTITMVRVDSTGGKQILNKQLSFTAKNIPVSQLSKDQQQALLNRQDHYPYEVQYINFAGFDTLLNSGVSSEQLQAIQSYLYAYSQQVHKQFWTITLDKSAYKFQVHNADSGDFNDHATFPVSMGGTTYTAHVTLDPINDVAYLQLQNSAGVTVYDSTSAHD